MLSVNIQGKSYSVDINNVTDISIPVSRHDSVKAFYLDDPHFKTVEADGFVGNVSRGGSCNVEDICFSPHGNGTHTECAGHISKEQVFIKDVLKNSLFLAKLATVEAGEKITREQIESVFPSNKEECKAFILRTLPNKQNKKHHNYSGTNPTYFAAETIEYLNSLGIEHLLTDLPSLDKEDDNKLLAHNAFFRQGEAWNLYKTVTEMIFVPDDVADGLYLLNLQTAAFESDASPSKPLLYNLHLI